MRNINKLQDELEIAVGVWLCISPWALGNADPLQAAGWSAIVIGLAVLVMSIEDLVLPSEVEEWVDFGLGLALMASPWLWDYSRNIPATLNASIAGVLISGVAAWALEHLGFPGIGSEPHQLTPH